MSKSDSSFILFLIFTSVFLWNYYFLSFQNYNSLEKQECDKLFAVNISYQIDKNKLKESLLSSWSSHPINESIQLFTKRDSKSRSAIVIFFLNSNPNQEALLYCIQSVVTSTSLLEKSNNGIVVVFEDTFSDLAFLSHLVDTFFYEIQLGFIQFYRVGTHTYQDYFENAGLKNPDVKNMLEKVRQTNTPLVQTYSIMKLLFKVGHHLKTTFEHILITDEFFEILIEGPFLQLEKQLRKPFKTWSVFDFSNHLSVGFLGKMIHSSDVFKFTYFYMFYLSENINDVKINDLVLQKVHKKYINLVYQSNFIITRPLLMIPLRMLTKDERKTSRMDHLEELYKGKVISDDPMAVIVTNMSSFDHYHTPEMMYSTLGEYFFHAVKPYNDWLVFVFEEPINLERIVIISGISTSNLPSIVKSSLVNDNKSESITEADANNLELSSAVLESSHHLMKLNGNINLVKCADYRWVGKMGGRVSSLGGLTIRIKRPTKCLKVNIYKDLKNNDVVFRQIAIFSV